MIEFLTIVGILIALVGVGLVSIAGLAAVTMMVMLVLDEIRDRKRMRELD